MGIAMTCGRDDDGNVFVMTMTLTLTVNAMMCVGRAEKQKRVDVCVGFLNDNKNKAEEMRQVVEKEALMILMLLTAGARKI